MSDRRINSNSVSLAGEFAALSQLALRGYDANMTLGNAKGVDILVSDPKTKKLYQLEVKTNYKKSKKKGFSNSKIHGKSVSEWIMKKKHETDHSPTLFYCFISIFKETKQMRFFIVPSLMVARYVKKEHELWIRKKKKERKKVQDGDMRIFRIGIKNERYVVRPPDVSRYENNWGFEK